MNNITPIEVLEWKQIERQGASNGKQNTQLELSLGKLPVNIVMKKLMDQLVICRKHVGEMRWINFTRKLDLTMSNPEVCRVICTDFGATLDLHASEKDNSSIDNHAVICIFFVAHKWRRVTFKNKDGINDEKMMNNCDKWIVFGDTMSKGKKNDHVFHNAALTHIVKFYEKERGTEGMLAIKNNIVHTDNCPTQYKCRQNFYKVATFAEHTGSRLIHKFGQKYGFKGSWDATGKLVKGQILKNELKFDRCANALDCYLKLNRDLYKDGTGETNKKWSLWEKNGDERIIQKTNLTTDRTFIGLGVEYRDQFTRLKEAGHDHIILTDRDSIPDMKVVEGTHSIFQIQGDIDPISPKKWSIHTAILPCACPPCRSNPFDINTCLYKESRKLRSRVVNKLEPITPNDDAYGINSLTVPLLKDELRARGLSLSGNKPELRNRLQDYLMLEDVENVNDTVDNAYVNPVNTI